MRSKNPELMQNIKTFVESFFKEYGCAPTVQAIANEVGIGKSTAHNYLKAMAERHIISYEDGIISTDKIVKMSPAVNRAALVGVIPCGIPEVEEQQVEEYIPLPVSIFGNGDFYVLRASGDSMIEAQIDDGDLVVIERCQDAEVGDIVVALTNDNESTLKTLGYDKAKRRYFLHPENQDYEDIYVKSLKVQGVARNIIKQLR